MIYIFDDRAQRRKDNEEKLREFSNLITFKTITLTPEMSVEDWIIDSMENPECIIFHKSYVFEDKNITDDTVWYLFTYYDVPIVIFSGGTEGSNKGDKKIIMNADLMYQNLPYFLQNFKENEKINIDTLLWGKQYKLNAILQFQNEISKDYFILNNPENYVEDIPKLTRIIRLKCKTINEENLGNNIIAEINSHIRITWHDVADIIDNQIKNISK